VKKWLFNILLIASITSSAQETAAVNIPGGKYSGYALTDSVPFDQPSNNRKWIAGGVTAVGYAGSFILLSQAWYNDYPRSSFHTFNDAGEWMQMDKIGHSWTSYTLSRVSSNMWQWAGMKKDDAVLIGSGSGLLYLLSIEYLDGRSSQWGWSWADVAADVFGTGLYAAQELGWKEQRLQLKFSVHKEQYTEASLMQRADELFGKSVPEKALKDYNQQTYWLSFNLASILQSKKIPGWLNIAIGHGAEGMFGGYENVSYDKDGNVSFDRRDIKRYRQWYLAPDIDLTRIKTRSAFLRSVFSAVNILKFPAPGLEFSNGKLQFKAIIF
jgi:uncharacterized protein YfiM (DUF2279 family)